MPDDDVATRRIALGAAGIAGTVVGVIVVVLLWLHATGMPPPTEGTHRMPGPALQSAPQPDLAAYRAEKQRLTGSSGWVDAPRRIVRIPVDEAMALMAERAASAAEARQ